MAPTKDSLPNLVAVIALLGSGECQAIIAMDDPKADYIFNFNKWRGIRLEYPNHNCSQNDHTVVHIECDETYKGVFLSEVDESNSCNLFIRFKSNIVCRPKESSSTFYYMLAIFIIIAIYFLATSIWLKYTNRSFTESVVHSECWANCCFKIKEMLNTVVMPNNKCQPIESK